VLEDSPSGIKAGVAAGIPVVGLSTGQEAGTLVGAGASLVLANYEELMEVIEGQLALVN